jgi:hypothetical protein
MPSRNAPSRMDAGLIGPDVWPSLAADKVVDRYLHRWVEIPYLEAVRMREQELDAIVPDTLEATLGRTLCVHVEMKRGNSRKGWRTIGRFTHTVDTVDRKADVVAFLRNLKGILSRTMPDSPVFDTSVRLEFKSGSNSAGRTLKTHQERWA